MIWLNIGLALKNIQNTSTPVLVLHPKQLKNSLPRRFVFTVINLGYLRLGIIHKRCPDSRGRGGNTVYADASRHGEGRGLGRCRGPILNCQA